LDPYTLNKGWIRLDENDTEFLFNYEWPGAGIQGFTSYHLFCLVLDKQNGNISLIIDGQSALRQYRPWIRNSKLQPGEVVFTKIGDFVISQLRKNTQLTSLV
jgi:hypothetical protein